MMESRDAACFVMLAGLLCSCSRCRSPCKPALKAKAAITGALEAVYVFKDAGGNDVLGLRPS